MKKSLAFILLLFTVISAFSQSVSDYEYIYVPKKFKAFEENKYNLNTLLKNALGKKNYKIIQDEPQYWTAELKQNPCKVLTAELLNASNMFRNKVNLQFTDCQNRVVVESKATSDYKEFDLGFQDALAMSLRNIPNSQPKNNTILAAVPQEKPIVENTIEKPVSASPQVANSTVVPSVTEPKKAEVFSNGTTNLQKIQISKDQFILVSSESSLPFATFKNTTKSDVYRVTLENGTSTLGYSENGNLIIEIPTSDGNYKKEVFTAK